MTRDAMHHSTAARTVAACARHEMPRLAQQRHPWLQLQRGTRCHALPDSYPHDGSICAAFDATFSSTAVLLVAASAWHVMPCVARQLPTKWQNTLGSRCRTQLNSCALGCTDGVPAVTETWRSINLHHLPMLLACSDTAPYVWCRCSCFMQSTALHLGPCSQWL